MASSELPAPSLMALVAIAMELGVGRHRPGVLHRPLALVLAIHAVIAAVIGHPCRHMSGRWLYEGHDQLQQGFDIAGGLLLLMLAGPERYSFDRR